MSENPHTTRTLAIAIRELADQYRDLAIAEELDHVAIHAEQYPDMPATGRMQRALWDAEEVLLERLRAIQSGVSDISTAVNELRMYQDGQGAVVNGLQVEFHAIADTVAQLVTDLATLNNRDARQFADSAQRHAEAAQDRAGIVARLDRIEQSLIGRDALVAQHLGYEERIVALERARLDDART